MNLSSKFRILQTFNRKVSSIYTCNSIRSVSLKLLGSFHRRNFTLINSEGTIKYGFFETRKPYYFSQAEIESWEYKSFQLIESAERYKRLRLQIKNSTPYYLPNKGVLQGNVRYLISIIEVALKKYYPKNDKVLIFTSSTGNRLIDKLMVRYFKRNHNIDISIELFSRLIISNDLLLQYKKLKPLYLLKYSWSLLPSEKKCFDSYISRVYIHHPKIDLYKPFNSIKPSENKDNFLSLDFKDFCRLGSKPSYSLIFLIKRILKYTTFSNLYALLKYNLLIDYLDIISNELFLFNSINFLKLYKVKSVICSYISFDFENLIYDSCRAVNVRTIMLDYSLGYPCSPNKNRHSKVEISLARFPDYILVSSDYRKQQYLAAITQNNRNVNTVVLKCICPLVTYAIENSPYSSKKLKHKDYFSNNNNQIVKLSIFDNVYGANYHLAYSDTDTLSSAIANSNIKFEVLAHSKSRSSYLTDSLSRGNIEFLAQKQGSFSAVYNVDFVISIGFQGSALKAALAFDKPILFYINNPRFFEQSECSFTTDQDNSFRNLIDNLTYNEESIKLLFNSFSTFKSSYNQLHNSTRKLFREIFPSHDSQKAIEIIDKLTQFRNY